MAAAVYHVLCVFTVILLLLFVCDLFFILYAEVTVDLGPAHVVCVGHFSL